jgi:AAA domain
VSAFIASVRELGDVRLVILDTLNGCMSGRKDELNGEMSQASEGAKRIAEETGAQVLLCHHTGKNGMTPRGGYALECNTDTRFRIGKPGAPSLKPGGILALKNEKQRDTDLIPPIQLKAELMSLPDESTTLVLSDGVGKRTPRQKDLKKRVLDLHDKGMRQVDIAARLEMNASTVRTIIRRAEHPRPLKFKAA